MFDAPKASSCYSSLLGAFGSGRGARAACAVGTEGHACAAEGSGESLEEGCHSIVVVWWKEEEEDWQGEG